MRGDIREKISHYGAALLERRAPPFAPSDSLTDLAFLLEVAVETKEHSAHVARPQKAISEARLHQTEH